MPETITVTGIKELTKGRSESGRDWTLYAVDAVDANGQPITEKLRTFEGSLPEGEPIEVEMEMRNDPKYGVQYTVKRAGGSRGGASGTAKSGELDRRVSALEKWRASVEGNPEQGQTPAPVSDDDIPF